MPLCPITYEEVSGRTYSRTGLTRLSRRLDHLEDLPFTPDELRREALGRASKMSIQGLQPKLSAALNVPEGRFEIVDRGGQYILKPPVSDYPEVPENEDVTMRLAAAAGVEVPLHGMIYTSDGALCYFIKRFDRTGRRGKRAVEDFAQLLGYTRDTKYASSMEEVARVIEKHCTFPVIEYVKLFRRTMVSFLCGNEDMHLKNVSLITRDNKVELSPAYDLLNTTIVMVNPQVESALPISGKKSNIKCETLLEYFALERLKLTRKAVDGVLADIKLARSTWIYLLERSFLSSELKTAYLELVDERWRRMEL